jgi:micrococcal nuclease
MRKVVTLTFASLLLLAGGVGSQLFGEASQDDTGNGAATDRPDARDSGSDREGAVSAPAAGREPRTDARRRGRLHPVVDVVDGDTVKVAYRGTTTSVRVIGIDTPETVHPSEPVECGGPEASAAAERLLAGTRVRLVFDPSQGRVDAYGRLLAYVEIPRVGDFGLAMIRAGHAAEYTYDEPYARQAEYKAAQVTAQDDRQGVWARCGGTDTAQPEAGNGRPASDPESAVRGGAGSGCASGYTPCVPPYPPDLDCADVDGPVRITGDDPHGFDADGDGFGCDS